MLYHTDLVFSDSELDNLYSGLAVKLHGALMKLIPEDEAEILHNNSLQPFSLFTMHIPDENLVLARLSVLTDEWKHLCDVLASCPSLKIYGMKHPLVLQNVSKNATPDIQDEAALLCSDKVRLHILSPAIYRSSGKSYCTPVLSRFFRSVIEKYNKFIKPLDEQAALSIIDGLHIQSYQLSGNQYNISGNIYNGMTGFTDIIMPKKTDDALVLKQLLAFAQYSGIGAKTAVGMGGITVENI